MKSRTIALLMIAVLLSMSLGCMSVKGQWPDDFGQGYKQDIEAMDKIKLKEVTASEFPGDLPAMVSYEPVRIEPVKGPSAKEIASRDKAIVGTIADCEDYLGKYPKGHFVDEIMMRRDNLKKDINVVSEKQGIRVIDKSVDFGTVDVGKESEPYLVMISSILEADLEIMAISVGGSDGRDFRLELPETNASEGAIYKIKMGDFIEPAVTFIPSRKGPHYAELTIQHKAEGGPIKVNLVGVGYIEPVKVDKPVPPMLSLVDHDFKDILLGQNTMPIAVTVSNQGKVNLIIEKIEMTGDMEEFFIRLPEDFTQGKPYILKPTEAIEMLARFNPTSEGRKTAVVNIYHNASKTPTLVTLTGIGIKPKPVYIPQFVLKTAGLEFGECETKGAPKTMFVEIENTGTGELQINKLTLIGQAAGEFNKEMNTLPLVILTKKSAKLRISFMPLSQGEKSVSLEIAHNAEGSPAVVTITGIGKAQKEEMPGMEGTTDPFPSDTVDTTGAKRIVLKDESEEPAGIQDFTRFIEGNLTFIYPEAWGEVSTKPGFETYEFSLKLNQQTPADISALKITMYPYKLGDKPELEGFANKLREKLDVEYSEKYSSHDVDMALDSTSRIQGTEAYKFNVHFFHNDMQYKETIYVFTLIMPGTDGDPIYKSFVIRFVREAAYPNTSFESFLDSFKLTE